MSPTDFDDFASGIVPAYAAAKVSVGIWEPADAVSLAREEFCRRMPDGIATAGSHVFSLITNRERARVGHLWILELRSEARSIVRVQDLYIEVGERRRGWGRLAMLALEHWATENHFESIALNVFGNNDSAQRLYHSLGYRPVSIEMVRSVSVKPRS